MYELPWLCCGSRVCSSWCVGALVGRLLHVCAMCTFLACWWCRVCSSSQHPQQTQHAKCVGGKVTTHAPAHRGAQLYSQFSSNNHRGDSRGVASVVSLATTRVQHAAAAATAAAAGHTARGEYVCGCCQRLVSGEERARWLCQLFSVACEASPHLSFSDRIYGMATVQYGPKLYYRASTLTFDIYYSAATLLMT